MTTEAHSSYGELAALWVPAGFRRLLDSLTHGAGDAALGPAGFTRESMPHETKDLRRLVGDVRDLLDIFCFAYPKKGGDTWQDVRKELARGYRRVGAFKDVFDAQEVEPTEAVYSDEELTALRLRILEWKRALLAKNLDFAAYLRKPCKDRVVKRSGEDLAPFFWGVHGAQAEPVLDDSGSCRGLANLRRLLRRLCDRLSPDVKLLARPPEAGGVGKIAGQQRQHESNRAAFHLFRKRLRTVVKLHGRFPLQPRGGVDPGALVAAIEQFVQALGDLNNRLLAYERDQGPAEREELAELINSRWRGIQSELRAEDLKGTLLALGRLARPSPTP